MTTELTNKPRTGISLEEYLVRERAAEYRADFVYGEIRAMAGGSLQHGRLIANLTGGITPQLRGKPCFAVSGDVKVAADPDGLYVYPDLTVVCGEPQFHDRERDVLLNPTVIFEVLSPTTEGYDRGLKSTRYRRLPSLREYVFICQTEPLIEHWVRQADGLWLVATITGLSEKVALDSIECRLEMAEVYDRVEFVG